MLWKYAVWDSIRNIQNEELFYKNVWEHMRFDILYETVSACMKKGILIRWIP